MGCGEDAIENCVQLVDVVEKESPTKRDVSYADLYTSYNKHGDEKNIYGV